MKLRVSFRSVVGALVSAALLLPIPAYAALTFLSWNPISSPSGLASWSSSGTTGGNTSKLTITPQSGSLTNSQTDRDFTLMGKVDVDVSSFPFLDTVRADPINLGGIKINSGAVQVSITVSGAINTLYNQQFSGPATLPNNESGAALVFAGTRTITVRFRFNPSTQSAATSWTALGPITITFGD